MRSSRDRHHSMRRREVGIEIECHVQLGQGGLQIALSHVVLGKFGMNSRRVFCLVRLAGLRHVLAKRTGVGLRGDAAG